MAFYNPRIGKMMKTQKRRNKREVTPISIQDHIMYQTVDGARTTLKDSASVEIDDSASKAHVVTKITESGVIAPEIGLVMEQTGTYMEYSSYIYVPVMYHMPHLAVMTSTAANSSCTLASNDEKQALIISILKEKVGPLVPKHNARRPKRFIETLLIGGVTAWNRASIWSLDESVAALDAQVAAMKEHSLIVTKSINTLIGNQQAIHHSVDRQARIITEFLERKTCEDLATNYFREVYSVWLSMAPNDFSRVVDSALSGKITPDLLPATDVVNVLLKHPMLINSAYNNDVSLLYELGRLTLHRVDYDPYPMVSGIMVFPKIIVDRSAAMMRVVTTHLKHGAEFRKLILPTTMACRAHDSCWSVAPLSCRDTVTLTLCPKQDKLNIDLCLSQVIGKTTPATGCKWSVASVADTEVAQFDGGVLVSATQDKGEVVVSQADELIVHRNTEPSDQPFVLTANDGDYFHIGGQLYQLAQATIRTGYEFKLNLTVPDVKYNLDGLVPTGWIDEDSIPELQAQPWTPPSHFTWWILVITLSLLGALLCILIYHRRKVVLLKRKVVSELLGWTTVPTAPPKYVAPASEAIELPQRSFIV